MLLICRKYLLIHTVSSRTVPGQARYPATVPAVHPARYLVLLEPGILFFDDIDMAENWAVCKAAGYIWGVSSFSISWTHHILERPHIVWSFLPRTACRRDTPWTSPTRTKIAKNLWNTFERLRATWISVEPRNLLVTRHDPSTFRKIGCKNATNFWNCSRA